MFYATGGGVTYYDLSDPTDPRPWEAVPANSVPDVSGSAPRYYMYGDLAFAGAALFVTRIAVDTPGTVGSVGQGQLLRYRLPVSPAAYAGGQMAIADLGSPLIDLGLAYADAQGDLMAGPWQVAPSGGVVYQRVDAVDPRAGTVTAAVCWAMTLGDGCDQQLFGQAGVQALDAHPALAPGADLVALTGTRLYVQHLDSSGFASYPAAGWGAPPQWSPDGPVLVATQLAGTTRDAAGVVHYATNVVAYTAGQAAVLVAGGQAWSWGP